MPGAVKRRAAEEGNDLVDVARDDRPRRRFGEPRGGGVHAHGRRHGRVVQQTLTNAAAIHPRRRAYRRHVTAAVRRRAAART